MMNVVTIMGRLTADPEYRTTPGGVHVVNFRLAVGRDYLNKTTQNREADFIPVTAWRGLADWVAKYCQKGQMVGVTGRLEDSEWTDKDNHKRWSLRVNAERIYFAGARRNTAPGADPEDPSGWEELPPPDSEDDEGMGDWPPEDQEEAGE